MIRPYLGDFDPHGDSIPLLKSFTKEDMIFTTMTRMSSMQMVLV